MTGVGGSGWDSTGTGAMVDSYDGSVPRAMAVDERVAWGSGSAHAIFGAASRGAGTGRSGDGDGDGLGGLNGYCVDGGDSDCRGRGTGYGSVGRVIWSNDGI